MVRFDLEGLAGDFEPAIFGDPTIGDDLEYCGGGGGGGTAENSSIELELPLKSASKDDDMRFRPDP